MCAVLIRGYACIENLSAFASIPNCEDLGTWAPGQSNGHVTCLGPSMTPVSISATINSHVHKNVNTLFLICRSFRSQIIVERSSCSSYYLTIDCPHEEVPQKVTPVDQWMRSPSDFPYSSGFPPPNIEPLNPTNQTIQQSRKRLRCIGK